MEGTAYLNQVLKMYSLTQLRHLTINLLLLFVVIVVVWPITMAARSNAWIVFASSNAGIVGSNSTQGMEVHVRVYSVFVLSGV
jgi:hypothetical protein